MLRIDDIHATGVIRYNGSIFTEKAPENFEVIGNSEELKSEVSPPEKTSSEQDEVFSYPSRRLGISSPHEVWWISSAPAGLDIITHQRASSCDLMIYNTSCW